jgi:transcriptional regulator with XRE-family HTH domain
MALTTDPDFLNEMFLLHVAGALSRRLKQLGLTQADLAARLGVSESAVSQLLSVSRPDAKLSTLQRAALAVGLKIEPSITAIEEPALPAAGEREAVPVRRSQPRGT